MKENTAGDPMLAVRELQTRLAYLEQSNDQLSQELFDQQRHAERLELRLNRLEQRMADVANRLPDESSKSMEDDVPPHY